MDIRTGEDADPKSKGQVFRPDRYLCVNDFDLDCVDSRISTILYFLQPILQGNSKPSRIGTSDHRGMFFCQFYNVQPGPLAFRVQLPGTFVSN